MRKDQRDCQYDKGLFYLEFVIRGLKISRTPKTSGWEEEAVVVLSDSRQEAELSASQLIHGIL